MLNNKISAAIAGALFTLACTSASAAVSVALSPANPTISPPGANSTVVTLVFTADGVASSHQGALAFDDAQFDITTLTSVGAGAVCSAPVDENGAGVVTITYSQAQAGAIPAGAVNVCTFVLDHVTVATGNFPYTFSSLLAEEPILGDPVPITGNNGNVTVSAGPPTAPTITYAPNPVNFPAGTAIPQNQDMNVTPTAAGGLNGGSTAVSCTTASPGFSIPTAATTCTDLVCAPTPLVFRCASSNAAQTGTATCTATPTNPAGAAVPTTINLTCPAANVAPTLTAAPNFDADAVSDATPEVTLPVAGIGMTASGTVAITPAAGSGTGSATMNACTGAGGIAVAPGGLTFTGAGTSAQNLTFSCTAAVAGFSGTVSCTETDFDSAGVTRLWDVLCPAGSPESAPGVTYAPAALSTLTFAQGASLGAITTQNVTVDINGGVDGGDANPESMSVSCTTASAGYSVSGAGPYSANSPAAVGVDGTVTVSCAAAAAPQLGTLTCTETPRIDAVPLAPTPRTWNLNCPAAAVNITANPAEGAIALVGPPNSSVAGSINLTNTGSVSTLACTATGAVTLGVVPASVPAGGAAAVPYTCLTGAAGVAGTGTIQCTTQDAAPDDVLDYTVSCLGLSSVPVPAVSNFGKVLLASLVIGLGLLGLGARRRMI